MLLSVGGCTNICCTTYNFETSRAYFSMFCKHCDIFDGEGMWNNLIIEYIYFSFDFCLKVNGYYCFLPKVN